MSDASLRPCRIRAQRSTQDPRAMRFILEAPVHTGPSRYFDGPAPDVPLAQALFAIDGVTGLQVSGETIMVTQASEHDWPTLATAIAAAIRSVLNADAPPLGTQPALPATSDADATMLAAVNQILETRANPAIARHGGRVTAECVKDGVVSLRMSGGCQGCAASARTLRGGVEKMLRAAVPGIRAIEDVTDHVRGASPYYRRETGTSITFHRSPLIAEAE